MNASRQSRCFAGRVASLLLSGLAALLIPGVAAAKPDNVTEAELKMLPRYCQDSMWFPERYKTQSGHWVSIMGRSFAAIHHYCWALTTVSRAQRAGIPAETRFSMRTDAVNDYVYVINNATPDFVLLPEIYTKLGEVELQLRHPNKAQAAFSNARAKKPDYWPAYSQWAEYLMKIEKRSEALELVTLGLKHAPEAKVLREQYRILGGKISSLPTAPVPAKEADAAPPTAPTTTPTTTGSAGEEDKADKAE